MHGNKIVTAVTNSRVVATAKQAIKLVTLKSERDCVFLPAIPFWKLGGAFLAVRHVRAQDTHDQGTAGSHVKSLGCHTLYCTSTQMAACNAMQPEMEILP